MKIIKIVFLLCVATISHSQKNEIDFNYRFGIPTNNFSVFFPDGVTRYHHEKMRSVNDHGIMLSYKYEVWKRAGLFLSAGIELSSSKHYQPIFAIGSASMHLDNVVINKKRFTVHLFGLHEQIKLYDDKIILDLGVDVVNRFYFTKTDYYSSDFIKNNNPGDQWIDYKYDLTTHYDEYYENESHIDNKSYMYLNLDLNAHLKFYLNKRLLLNFGFNYSRNNIFFYDYTHTVRYYYGGSSIPTSTYTNAGLSGSFDPKYGIRDHYLYLNIGLSYKFGKNE